MGRSVYFSFHYKDVAEFRANVVRHSGKIRKQGTDAFRDGSIWEEAEEKKIKTIKKLIDQELVGTSVNCVLIGSETYSRRFVRYEIVKSFAEKKGLLGVHINWIKDNKGYTKFFPGENPFKYLKLRVSDDGKSISFYEWKENNFLGGWEPYKDLLTTQNRHFGEDYFGESLQFNRLFKTYSYKFEDGYNNLPQWVEKAAQWMGR